MLNLPISVIIATRNRSNRLSKTIESIFAQTMLPSEILVLDESDQDYSKVFTSEPKDLLVRAGCYIKWARVVARGSAAQRNLGVTLSAQPYVWFVDDDVDLKHDCLEQLWSAISSNCDLGGVSAHIVNQTYVSPGFISRLVLSFMNGTTLESYGGKVLGPAINLLPEDRGDAEPVSIVDWLNTTCTLYRKSVLPTPPFPSHFTGYSLCEDLALSIVVARKWKLGNARRARLYHDSQLDGQKRSEIEMGYMEIVNRHYVMTKVLARKRAIDYFKFGVWEAFQLVSKAVQHRAGCPFWRFVYGNFLGIIDIIRNSGGCNADK